MASVLKRGGVWYAKWTDASGERRREPTQARSKAEAKALADELEVEARRRRNHVQRARNGLPSRPKDLTGTLSSAAGGSTIAAPRPAGAASSTACASTCSRLRLAPCPSP